MMSKVVTNVEMRIRELREQRGLTQQELASSMGVVRNAVTNWETETTLPKTRQLPLLAEVLGVPIGDLFVRQSLKGEMSYE